MTASNGYGRQVVIPLANKSGGSVGAGDVVVVDTGNNDAFTTTTSAGFTGGVAIAQETIANNATGRILTQGYAALVNVNASVTRGHFGKTHTVAKQATDAGATRGAGTFCQFLTGGTTPDAIVYPVDLLGSSLTNPMTTTGDIIYSSDNSGTPARLGIGSTGQGLKVASGLPSWGAVLNPGQTYSYPASFSGDTIDGSSTTPFVDVVAFDTKEVLNSRILHLKTLGASKDQKVRVTLGTTKAGAFDVSTAIAFNGMRWTSNQDTYFEIRLSTSADAQICSARIYGNFTSPRYYQMARVGGSGAVGTSNIDIDGPLGQTLTLRFTRDGSNVILFYYGWGTAPMTLTPFIDGGLIPVTATVSGTLARVEYASHTPSGPSSTAEVNMYVDWLASV